jgi:hypothetical protein
MAEATLLVDGKSGSTYTENMRLYVLAFAVVLAAELIGIVNVPVGPANIVLLPLLWALLIGGAWSVAENRVHCKSAGRCSGAPQRLCSSRCCC